MKLSLLFLCLSLSLSLAAQRSSNDLNGTWTFAIDPLKVGETNQWFDISFPADKFDKVNVPHCFSVDQRYAFYTGTAWYFRKFKATAPKGQHVWLKFDAVFYKAKVWLNGKRVAQHEGGYTPFETDVTSFLQQDNILAVQVNNEWDTTTLPGAKTSVLYEPANASQVYPWINYGGITRPVQLLTMPAVDISNAKITTNPDLEKGSAVVQINAFIRNSTAEEVITPVDAVVYQEKNILQRLRFKQQPVTIKPGETKLVMLSATLPAKQVKLWSQDAPELYRAEISCGMDTFTTRFGIRKVEVRGTSLLLNGIPIKMAGGNRPLDYPGVGSMDPMTVLEKDMLLMKRGSMELSRISHYPVSADLLNKADELGLLIIAEAGNWQMTPKQMSDSMMRHKYRSQMQEMIAHDWNHPSVIAYSLGNEFQAQKEEGKAWVRDMRTFVRNIDSTRLITFASNTVQSSLLKKPEEEASQYVDFISTNIYGNHLKALQHIHELYPEKPVYISEFGWRTDQVASEENRIVLFKKAMADIRQCSYIIGASVWTFNDYLSRFPGSAADGSRPWGLVTLDRKERGLYKVWQEEMSPAVLAITGKQGNTITIRLTVRKDFPGYPLNAYNLLCNGENLPVKYLKPGEFQEWTIDLKEGKAITALMKPGGYTILEKILE
ncbi:glycoside hydrolase family 2 protein [Chitinophaga sp. RAB17]|uniref:glycoside hydrolase family 2 protein n=1 Tax=Chitinophaga sp. RAB17 TaxID=3233049 RepID=UPI003F8F1DED